MTLTRHFLADGVNEMAYIFSFLPLYFVNAKQNPNVGLHRALGILAVLADTLFRDGFADQSREPAITVDLQDLLAFTKEVRSTRIFLAVADNCHIEWVGEELHMLVDTKHWLRVNHE